MNINLNKQILESYNWRFVLAGFSLAFSILLSGSVVYLSEIFFILFLLLCFFELRFNPILAIIGLSCLSLLFFFSIGIDRGFNEIFFIILLLCLPSFYISSNPRCIDSLVYGIAIALSFSALYAFSLLAMKVILPGMAEFFEPCFYGNNRSLNSCGIPPYMTSGFSLQRLYGLASEPSTYGMSHVVLLSLVISNHKVKISSNFMIIQIMSILATISITAITLLIIVFGVMKFKKIKMPMQNIRESGKKNFRIIFGILTILTILVVSVEGFSDAIMARTQGRLLDLFLGEDTSAFMRSAATWLPVLSFFTNVPFSQILFGMGLDEYIYFLKEFSTFTFVDGNLVIFEGQKGSIFSTLIISYGLFPVITLCAALLILDRFRFTLALLSVFGFLFFHTVTLSFSTLALIYIVGISKGEFIDGK